MSDQSVREMEPDGWRDWPPLARAAALAAEAAGRCHDVPVTAGGPPDPDRSPASAAVTGGGAGWATGCADPLFVLTAGRSGSTLLRFVLDAHPELGCPPETELPALCTQLAAVWSLFASLISPGDRPGAAAIPEPVIAGMRHAVNLMVGPYLAQRGKRRYCDKSIGSAHHAGLLARMWPQARFVCLYCHPMDLIASGLEACPWGLNSYGFEHYIGGSPGNAVAAIARYWADHTAAILAAEESFPGRSHRVRYEDLVADPDTVIGRIFGFAGVPPVPGISASFFTHERERFGRSDFKIWNTSRITAGSVGRGWAVPAVLIPPPLMATVNELAARLGYRLIDEAWGTRSRPADMLAPTDDQVQGDPPVTQSRVAGLLQESRLLDQRIRAGLARLDDSFAGRWQPYSAERFLVVAAAPQGAAADARWMVDLSARTVDVGERASAGAAHWRAAGTTDAWQQVIRDGVNLGVAFRRGDLRYSDTGDAGPGSPAADSRVAMMADLLGITTWPVAAGETPSPVLR